MAAAHKFPGAGKFVKTCGCLVPSSGTNDADDRIVYNKTSGGLLHDLNGNAAGSATMLAAITNKPTLTAADFVVV